MNQKLSAADIENIKALRKEGMSQKELAKEFGVTQARISQLTSTKKRPSPKKRKEP